ncbi:MAG: hypothetical protein Q7R34_11650 [Dehalococcoidia bacterium]|nr:hypothetical protein [Dehalococcoidia bacterium]
MGRRTISRTLCALGRSGQDWNADYKMFSRSRWRAESLFDLVIEDYLVRYPEGPITVAVDDTKLAKTGKHIATAFWQRDPMSPPFHINFIYGLRFVPRCIGVVSTSSGGQLLGAWVSGGISRSSSYKETRQEVGIFERVISKNPWPPLRKGCVEDGEFYFTEIIQSLHLKPYSV